MSSSSTPGKDDLGTSAELPSQTEHRRTRASKHFTHVMDNLQSKIFIANQRLNDLTGYSGIESLKASIETQEALASETRATVREAKDAYTTAIAQRSASQREVNELLQRKHNWTAADLERFTELYRSDHANEQAEQAAADALAAAETQAEEIGSRLSKSILARYHEEQIWSDKIRRMSTWGTWGLMGVNILLFIIFQVAVEPWRRKRLVSGFEEKVKQAFELEKMTALAGTTGVVTTAEVEEVPLVEKSPEVIDDDPSLLSQDTAGVESTDSPQSSPPAPSTTIERLRASAADLVSERAVTLRRVDLTTLVMEGMAVGAASVALAFWLIGLRRG
jgi:sensitive to high expression protein 9